MLRAAVWAEKKAARLQGKGSGAGTVDHEVALAFEALGREPSLAVDIGGNVGTYAAAMRARKRDLEIHVFEPSSHNVAALRNRFAADDAVSIVPAAVSDLAGSATLFSNKPGSSLGSLANRRLDHFKIVFDHQEEVKTIRFEDYWKETLQRRPVDIAKIDIEGYELAALNGFGEAIEATAVLQFEFGGCNIDTRTYFQDFWYFFKGRGFSIYRVSPLGLQPVPKYREIDEFFSVTNYIAVNEALAAGPGAA